MTVCVRHTTLPKISPKLHFLHQDLALVQFCNHSLLSNGGDNFPFQCHRQKYGVCRGSYGFIFSVYILAIREQASAWSKCQPHSNPPYVTAKNEAHFKGSASQLITCALYLLTYSLPLPLCPRLEFVGAGRGAF